MQVKYIGLGAVVLISGAIIGYKTLQPEVVQTANHSVTPRVLMVANLGEADEAGDTCAEMIQMVRAERNRGIAVQELDASSKSPLLTKYHVLTIPTVLFLDTNGKETARLEGEGGDVLQKLQTRLAQLK